MDGAAWTSSRVQVRGDRDGHTEMAVASHDEFLVDDVPAVTFRRTVSAPSQVLTDALARRDPQARRGASMPSGQTR